MLSHSPFLIFTLKIQINVGNLPNAGFNLLCTDWKVVLDFFLTKMYLYWTAKARISK